MCNLSQGVIDRATVDYVISMLKKSDMNADQCLDLIGIPESRWESYRQVIEEKMGMVPA